MSLDPTFQLDNLKLYLGDCRQIMTGLDLPRSACILTDPPYGVDFNTDYTRFTGGTSNKHFKHLKIEGDKEPFDPTPYLDFDQVILWGANCFSNRLPTGSLLVWNKRPLNKLGKFMSDCEVAWKNGGHGVYLFHHVWDGFLRDSEFGDGTLHPTQKPVALMEWVIKNHLKEPRLIVDPFMGSSPVGEACQNLGIEYIGIEIEPFHFETSKTRLIKAKEKSLFFGQEIKSEPQQNTLF